MARLRPEARRRLLFLAIAVSAVVLFPIFKATAVPPIPHQIFGSAQVVTESGLEEIPDGTLIRVELATGQEIASTLVTSGRYGSSPTFYIPGDDQDTFLVIEGAQESGQEMRVLVDQYLAGTVEWESGSNTELNLQVPEDRLLVLENVLFTISVGGVDVSVDEVKPNAFLDAVRTSATVKDRAGTTVADTTVVVRWGDGQSATTLTGPSGAFTAVHTYPLAGTYEATIAILKSGYVGSPVSQGLEVVAPEDFVPPAAPTGFTATPGNSQVSLMWTSHPARSPPRH